MFANTFLSRNGEILQGLTDDDILHDGRARSHPFDDRD